MQMASKGRLYTKVIRILLQVILVCTVVQLGHFFTINQYCFKVIPRDYCIVVVGCSSPHQLMSPCHLPSKNVGLLKKSSTLSIYLSALFFSHRHYFLSLFLRCRAYVLKPEAILIAMFKKRG